MAVERLETLVPPAERRCALDRAHVGDIEGALGRLAVADTGPRRSHRHRIATLLAVMGPGVFVMVAGNDAGGISTYAEAGQDYGARLLWLLAGLAVVLFVNQEMVVRLGAVTGAGHTRLIRERFGRRWGVFAVGDLLLLNLFTLVTDFIGVTLGLGYFGVSRYLAVPAAGVVLGLITFGGSYRRFERLMYGLVAVSLLVVPLASLGLLHHGTGPPVLGVEHGLHPSSELFMIALCGATVAPWQLFLQQSTVVDKRITSRWIGYERADTVVGLVLFALSAVAIVAVCAVAFDGSAFHGAFVDAGDVAEGIRVRLGPAAGALFAVFLLNGSVLGAGAVSLSTSYAVGDALGVKHSLHRRWRDAPIFHGAYVVVVVIAGALVLLPNAPLGLVTTSVQALTGVLLPSASVFLLLLCNDRAVLGPWVNPRWLNALATAVVAGLLALSAVVTATAFAPRLGLRWVEVLIGVLLGAALAAVLWAGVWTRRPGPVELSGTVEGPAWRQSWTMPPLDRLKPPSPTRARTVGLVVLRSYMVIAGAALVAEVLRLALRH